MSGGPNPPPPPPDNWRDVVKILRWCIQHQGSELVPELLRSVIAYIKEYAGMGAEE